MLCSSPGQCSQPKLQTGNFAISLAISSPNFPLGKFAGGTAAPAGASLGCGDCLSLPTGPEVPPSVDDSTSIQQPAKPTVDAAARKGPHLADLLSMNR